MKTVDLVYSKPKSKRIRRDPDSIPVPNLLVVVRKHTGAYEILKVKHTGEKKRGRELWMIRALANKQGAILREFKWEYEPKSFVEVETGTFKAISRASTNVYHFNKMEQLNKHIFKRDSRSVFCPKIYPGCEKQWDVIWPSDREVPQPSRHENIITAPVKRVRFAINYM